MINRTLYDKESHMKCHRLNEVLELLQPYWSNEPELNLIQVLQNCNGNRV